MFQDPFYYDLELLCVFVQYDVFRIAIIFAAIFRYTETVVQYCIVIPGGRQTFNVFLYGGLYFIINARQTKIQLSIASDRSWSHPPPSRVRRW